MSANRVHDVGRENIPVDLREDLEPVTSGERWKLRFEMDEPDGIVVVATGLDEEVVGFASAGPTRDEDAPTEWELYAINVMATHHGTGVANELIGAAIARRPTTLWVGRDNARAGAFYRRHGFCVEGGTKVHEGSGAAELRMVRRSGAGDGDVADR